MNPKGVDVSLERQTIVVGIVNLIIGLLLLFWTLNYCHDCNETCVGCSMQVPPQYPYCFIYFTVGFVLSFAGAYLLIRSAIALLRFWLRRRFHG